jgi:Fic family protein
MPKQLPLDLLQRVTSELERVVGGVSIEELTQSLAHAVSRRSLQRRLAEWVTAGLLRAEGARKGRRYFLPKPNNVGAPPEEVKPTTSGEIYLPTSHDGREIREWVNRPIVDRPPVGYQPEFLDRYQPNVTAYLPETLTRHLRSLGESNTGRQPAGTYARSILERLLIDLSWSSSRLEGNTYSLLDTQQLIRAGSPAPGKDPKETQMILNHKAAIELLVGSAEEIGVNRFTLLNLHALLADNLLDDPLTAGRLRETPIAIGASTYLPTAIPQLIESQFTALLNKASAIENPFEQSFFLMVQLPYLQPFVDVNKRVSRLAANISLIKTNLIPLSFIDVPVKAYVDGLIGVYELNRVELLRDIFAWAYERSSRQYKTIRESLPEPDPFKLQYRSALIEVVSQIVRQGLQPSRENIEKLAAPLLPSADLSKLIDLVATELTNLHEGSIARFRLRPSEWKEWQESRGAH